METDAKTGIKKYYRIPQHYRNMGHDLLLGATNLLQVAAKTLIRGICLVPVDRMEAEKESGGEQSAL